MKLELCVDSTVQKIQVLTRYFKTGLAAFGVGLAIVLLFALHPSVNAYHTGFAGMLVAAIFLAAVVTGAFAPRMYVLIAVLFLAFVEPAVEVTNTLSFNIVSDGLLIGAGANWLLNRPRIARSSLPLLGAIGVMASMSIVVPAIFGSVQWIDIHDFLMFGKYGLVVVLAITARPGKKTWLAIAGSIAAASLIVAMFTILHSFRIPAVSTWTFSTYLTAWDFSDEEFAKLTTIYTRAYGVAGPTGTAALLVMSFGAWFVLLIKSDSFWKLFGLAFGVTIVLTAIYLTGSRLGVLIAIPILIMGFTWFKSAKCGRSFSAPVTCAFGVTLLMVVGFALVNSSFGENVSTSNSRFANTLPDLLQGQPDPSVKDRIDEYAQLDVWDFRLIGVRDTSWSSEYIVLLYRFGLAGFLLVWQFWLILLVRSVRASTYAMAESDRLLGIIAVVAVVSAVVSAIGSHALLEPSLMTVILIAVGVLPTISVFARKPSAPELQPVAAIG